MFLCSLIGGGILQNQTFIHARENATLWSSWTIFGI
jgi:hypothetical protein